MTHLSKLLQADGVYRPPKGGSAAIAKGVGRSQEATRSVHVGWKYSSNGKKIPPMLIDGALAVIHWHLWAPTESREKLAVAFLLDLFGKNNARFWRDISAAALRLAGPTEMEAEDALKTFQLQFTGRRIGPDDQAQHDELLAALAKARGDSAGSPMPAGSAEADDE